jgi:hypothetical protein
MEMTQRQEHYVSFQDGKHFIKKDAPPAKGFFHYSAPDDGKAHNSTYQFGTNLEDKNRNRKHRKLKIE